MASFGGEQDGAVRFISDTPPAHYQLKIQSFSVLVKHNVEKYESAEFDAAGYKWKLVLYPNGNKTKSVYDHISLYLRLADTSALRHGWELSAFCRLFLLDQKRIKYLVFQDTDGKESHFHELNRECGLDYFLPLSTFTSASNGFLMEDECVLGAEIFVTKEIGGVKVKSLSMVKDPATVKYVWKFKNFSIFSKVNASSVTLLSFTSEAFTCGGQKWMLELYPNGLPQLNGSHVSLFLVLVDRTPDAKVYADYTLCMVNQSNSNHISFKTSHCFTPTSSDWGWPQFAARSYLADPGNGFLVQDTCIVEAEVTVWGYQTSSANQN